jgi:hypothetical protein
MKRIIFTFLVFLIVFSVTAQPAQIAEKEIFQFAKKVTINAPSGKNFRYEMAVRSETGDTVSGIRFFGAAADRNDKLFDNKFFQTEKRTEQEWTIYTIVGRMPENTASVWFYTSVTTTGTFYFDDISLFVESQPGAWKQLDIYNSSFEERSPGIVAGFAIMNQKSGNPKTALSQKIYKTGKYSLMVIYSAEKEPVGFTTGG